MDAATPTTREPATGPDPRWLGAVSSGVGYLILGVVLSVVMLVLQVGFEVVGMLDSPPLPGQQASRPSGIELLKPAPLAPWLALARELCIAAVSLVFCIGGWRMTAPEPGATAEPPARSLTRWTIVPGHALGLPFALISNSQHPALYISSALLSAAALVMMALALPASLIYLRSIAKRTGANHLIRHTTALFWCKTPALVFLLITFACTIASAMIVDTTTLQQDTGKALLLAVTLIAALLCLIIVGCLLMWWFVLMCKYRASLAKTARGE